MIDTVRVSEPSAWREDEHEHEDESDLEVEDYDEIHMYLHSVKGDGGDHDWYSTHLANATSWTEHIDTSQGLLGQNFDLFLKHFGLTVWSAHTRVSRDIWHRKARWSTGTYLTLPHSSCERIFDRRLERGENPEADPEEDDFLDKGPWPSEISNGRGIPVETPRPLSETDVAKFKRAFEILGLSKDHVVWPAVEGTLSASPNDPTDAAQRASGSRRDEPWVPKLRLLLDNQLESHYYGSHIMLRLVFADACADPRLF